RGCIADQSFAPLFRFFFMLNVVRHLAVLIEQATWGVDGEPFNLGQNHIVEFLRNDKPGGISTRLGAGNAGFLFGAVPPNAYTLRIFPIHPRDRPSSILAAVI